jgi:predicted nucleic acid-binding protein
VRLGIDILLDACVAINLIASRRRIEIGRACRARFLVVREVANETTGLPSDVPDAATGDIAQAGDFAVVEMTTDEQADFVELASEVDDGEAATLAVARHRRLRLATDDRAALRLIARQDPEIQVARTSSLIREWAERSSVPASEVAAALARVETDAQFSPPRSDPNATWWTDAREAGIAA